MKELSKEVMIFLPLTKPMTVTLEMLYFQNELQGNEICVSTYLTQNYCGCKLKYSGVSHHGEKSIKIPIMDECKSKSKNTAYYSTYPESKIKLLLRYEMNNFNEDIQRCITRYHSSITFRE